jgi:tRNA dimethylallyltransferase
VPERVIRILTGCTATGKSDLALDWAEAHGAEIVSCDSLLFYRGMDIGTARPGPEMRARVPHHLIDVCEPRERMDVKRYVTLALEVVRDIESRGRSALVVGGSGFYLRSFLAPVADDVPVDPAVRHEVGQQLEREGLASLVERLSSLNPGGLGGLDTRNPRRVTRALERCLVSGATLDDLAARFRSQPSPFAGWRIDLAEIARETAELRARIEARARAMVSGGLIEEVRRLREQGFEENPAAAGAIGYRETLAWIDDTGGCGDAAPLVDAIARNTWRLVRKQRTWFRSQLPAHRVIEIRVGGGDLRAALFPTR